MLKRVLTSRELKLAFFLMVLLGALILLVLEAGARSSISRRLLKQQQTITRAEAVNIESFFQAIGNSMSGLAQLDSIKTRGSQATKDLDAFVREWGDSNLVGGVLLTDKDGVVEFNSNVFGTPDIGTSLADRDYFLWAKGQKEAGEYFVGHSVISRVGASKEQVIVPVLSPVFKNGTFAGIVGASIKLQSLQERFLGLMKVSDAMDVYLINEQKVLLYSKSTPDLVGLSIESLDNSLKNFLYTSNEGTFRTSEYLIAFSPINLGSRNWLLIMASSAKGVADITTPASMQQTALLLLAFFSVVLLGIVIARTNLFFRK